MWAGERREFTVNFSSLGIKISEASVAKYMVRHPKPPSQTWRTFLKNHATQLASIDFFTVPTALFQILFVFIVIQHDRRRLVHFNVTAHPTAEWTARQILEAFPFDLAIYGHAFREQVAVMQIKEVLGAPRSPWQRAYVERVVGSIRRECLDHVIVLDEEGLRRVLAAYIRYYHKSRLHLSLAKGFTGSTIRTVRWQNCCDSRSRWPASPVRTACGLTAFCRLNPCRMRSRFVRIALSRLYAGARYAVLKPP